MRVTMKESQERIEIEPDILWDTIRDWIEEMTEDQQEEVITAFGFPGPVQRAIPRIQSLLARRYETLEDLEREHPEIARAYLHTLEWVHGR